MLLNTSPDRSLRWLSVMERDIVLDGAGLNLWQTDGFKNVDLSEQRTCWFFVPPGRAVSLQVLPADGSRILPHARWAEEELWTEIPEDLVTTGCIITTWCKISPEMEILFNYSVQLLF